jgi:hypothetical protein
MSSPSVSPMSNTVRTGQNVLVVVFSSVRPAESVTSCTLVLVEYPKMPMPFAPRRTCRPRDSHAR